jgi:hypothetical protein
VECSHEGSRQIELLGERLVFREEMHKCVVLIAASIEMCAAITLDDHARVAGAWNTVIAV